MYHEKENCVILFSAPSPPRKLTLQVKTSRSIQVSWEEPAIKNGNISGYIISYGQGSLDADLCTRDTKYLLGGLEEFTLYFVRVTAKTSILGNHSAIQQARTLEDGKIPFDQRYCNCHSVDFFFFGCVLDGLSVFTRSSRAKIVA